MIDAQAAPAYRFRPGALDAIARSRRFTSDEQLALYVGVQPDQLPMLRAGAKVSARVALRVSALQGDRDYVAGYFDLADDPRVAA